MKPYHILPFCLISLFTGCEKNPTETPPAENDVSLEQREKASEVMAKEARMKEKNMEEASEFTVPDAERKTPFDK